MRELIEEKIKFKYEGEQGKSYLVVEGKEIDFNSYQIHMITNNNIRGTLDATVRAINLRPKIYYDITSKLSLKQMIEIKKLNANDIITIINNLCQVIEGFDRYLLSEENCVLLPEYLYFQPDTLSPYVCVIPGNKRAHEHGELINEFIELLNESDVQADENLAYCLYRFGKLKSKRIVDLKNSLTSYLVEHSSSNINHYNDSSISTSGVGIERVETKRTEANRPDINRTDINRTDMNRKNINRTDINYTGINSYEGNNYSSNSYQTNSYDLDTDDNEIEISKTNEKSESDYLSQAKKLLFNNKKNTIYLTIGVSILGIVLVNLLFLKDSYGNYNIKLSFILNIIMFIIMGLAIYILNHRLESDNEEDVENDDLEFIPIFDFIDYSKPEENIVREPCNTQYIEFSADERNQESLLINMDSGEEHIINTDPYIIGKIEGTVSLRIDSPTVSRLHAQISKRGEYMYIQDLNSKNGTFIGGKRLDPGEEYRLTHKDVIAIAEILLEYNCESNNSLHIE